MNDVDAVNAARSLFLADGSEHGCAETTFVVLKDHYGLVDSTDSAAAMALNGGVAYSGGTCGAITGAALALGLMAAVRHADHGTAKRVARGIAAAVLDDFQDNFGAVDCRALTGIDLRAPGAHAAFIAGGTWRVGCMRQIEFVVRKLAPLGDEAQWLAAADAVDSGAGASDAAGASGDRSAVRSGGPRRGQDGARLRGARRPQEPE